MRTFSIALSAILSVLVASYVHATCSLSSTCLGKVNDISQSGGNLTAPSFDSCDTCPGHCAQDPAVLCDADASNGAECGSYSCLFNKDIFFGTCVCDVPSAGCTTAGRSCNSDALCYTSGSNYGHCASYVQPYGGDGSCTITYTKFSSATTTVTGSDGNDLMCIGALANTTVNGGAGDDQINAAVLGSGPVTINGGTGDDTITGSNSADTINGDQGNDTIHGGSGNDLITGGPLATSGGDTSGDDTIFGEGDDDVITGNGGRDDLEGGAGNDEIRDTAYVGFGLSAAAPDDQVGSLLCGGPGDDRIWTTGPRHRCVDAGSDQAGANTFSGYDCVYEFLLVGGRSADNPTPGTDIATMRNCRTPVNWYGGALMESPSKASCGCD
jgi:Ca2+-binding RTX toxin-like protein